MSITNQLTGYSGYPSGGSHWKVTVYGFRSCQWGSVILKGDIRAFMIPNTRGRCC